MKSQIKLRKRRSRISIRDRAIWNNLFGSTEKEIQSFFLSKTNIKLRSLNFENEVAFF